MIKYPWPKTGHHRADKKWNHYPTEAEAFAKARGSVPACAGSEKQSVEAAIMDWADDITYAVHDLEDFIRAGKIPISAMVASSPAALESEYVAPGTVPETIRFEIDSFCSVAAAQVVTKVSNVTPEQAATAFKSLFISQFLQSSRHTGSSGDLARLRSASHFLINYFVEAATLDLNGTSPIHVEPLVRAQAEMFKQLTWYYVINEPGLATLQEGQRRLVRTLFERLVGLLNKADKDGSHARLPTRLRELYQLTLLEPGSSTYPNDRARRARATADYIASLTEDQAADLFERVSGGLRHSVLDPWLAY